MIFFTKCTFSGINGPKGAPGDYGFDGQVGLPGEIGVSLDGPNGIIGDAGFQGPPGKPGLGNHLFSCLKFHSTQIFGRWTSWTSRR